MNTKQKYILTFSQKTADKPITYHLIKDFDLRVNIINAEITAHKRSYLLAEISGDELKLQSGIQFLKKNEVRCEPFKKQLIFDEEKCINCGACTGVCYSEALCFDERNARVFFYAKNCTACGLCIKACPLQLLSLNLQSLS